MEDKVLYEISMKTDVATYWYGKFNEFVKNNPEDFGDITFAEYIGEQVLNSMKLLFEGVATKPDPEVEEEQS